MYILNTTFAVHKSVRSEFLTWIRKTYIPAAESTGSLTKPQLTRVIGSEDPDSSSYALQFTSPKLREAVRWHDETAALLRDDMGVRFGKKVLFFTTYLEVIE